MSNPLRAPKVLGTFATGATAPSAYFEPGREFEARVKGGRNLEYLAAQLAPLDMERRATFVIPKEHTVDPLVLSKSGSTLAFAKGGKLTFRVRSGPAYGLLNSLWATLPEEGFAQQERVGLAIQDRLYVDGGAEYTLGRLQKAYPRLGSRVRAPVTRAEAEAALDNCGVRIEQMPAHAVQAYPLKANPTERGITINPKSDNGFPVMGQWTTPGAQARIEGLAVTVRQALVAASKTSDGVKRWKQEQEMERPWLVALRGKAKGDYYSKEKVEKGMLRFYNAFPRQIVMNMQVATQPLEAVARSILQGSRSGIGLTLVHGGAADMVEAMQRALDADGYAYVHVGDDSWVVRRRGGYITMFALDCSNFDLTQHADATLAVHDALRRQLRCIDVPAAELWYAYARERLVVVAATLVRLWRHAGPSGMPLQSKVNDMLMDVLINRVLARDCADTEEGWDAAIGSVGADLGFSVRVEQYVRLPASSIVEVLEQRPFLFVGYYFHVRGGQVAVCTDVPRTLAQMPYPGLKWMKTDKELEVMEAMRLGSMLLSAGIPPLPLEHMFAAWRETALKYIDRATEKEDVTDERLAWAVGESPLGPAMVPSLRGLAVVLRRDPRKLWLEKEPELPGTSVMVYGSWADEVEMAEEEAIRAVGGFVAPAPAALPRPTPLGAPNRATHPATAANDGRPPPTAVWGPPKQPRFRSPFEPRRKARRGRVLPEEEPEEWFDDEDLESEFYDDFGAEEAFGAKEDYDEEFRSRHRDDFGNYQ